MEEDVQRQSFVREVVIEPSGVDRFAAADDNAVFVIYNPVVVLVYVLDVSRLNLVALLSVSGNTFFQRIISAAIAVKIVETVDSGPFIAVELRHGLSDLCDVEVGTVVVSRETDFRKQEFFTFG